MKAKDMRNKSAKEITKDLNDARGKLAQAQIDYRTREVKNVREIRALRRDIARMMTVVRESQLASQGEKS